MIVILAQLLDNIKLNRFTHYKFIKPYAYYIRYGFIFLALFGIPNGITLMFRSFDVYLGHSKVFLISAIKSDYRLIGKADLLGSFYYRAYLIKLSNKCKFVNLFLFGFK